MPPTVNVLTSATTADGRSRGGRIVRHICDKSEARRERDIAQTQSDIAASIVRRFHPTGKLLDPCRGDGAFFRHMPKADWCEIREGRYFFKYNKHVDWIT